jgi:hypothetical protein
MREPRQLDYCSVQTQPAISLRVRTVLLASVCAAAFVAGVLLDRLAVMPYRPPADMSSFLDPAAVRVVRAAETISFGVGAISLMGLVAMLIRAYRHRQQSQQRT